MLTLGKNLIKTNGNTASLVLRLILGSVLFAHGGRNMMGWFGGNGYTAVMSYFTDIQGLPYIVGATVLCLQFFGAILILVGFTTRVMALGILGMFVGMIVTVHFEHGFFMNWFGTNPGEGYEYHLLVIAISAALVLLGGGLFSLDKKITDSIN